MIAGKEERRAAGSMTLVQRRNAAGLNQPGVTISFLQGDFPVYLPIEAAVRPPSGQQYQWLRRRNAMMIDPTLPPSTSCRK
jgi:hypothetical protein